MLNYDRSYFEIFSSNEVDSVNVKKNGNKNTLILNINDSIRAKYVDAVTTAIDLGEPIYILLDNEIVAAPMLTSVPEKNILKVTDNFSDEKARLLDAMVTYGAMPCVLAFGESSFDSNGYLNFTISLVSAPGTNEEVSEEADDKVTQAE